MECERCKAIIEPGEEREHAGRTLCEDCYMDALSPVKSCDPWAVHSAKSFEKHAGQMMQLTPIQSEILRILKEEGPMAPLRLLERLGGGLTLKELERDFAVLRHMEKVRGEKRQDGIIWRLW
jgi:hypothetical protein